MALVDLLIEFLEKRNRLEVLVAAVDIRNPFAALAAVVEVEHRRNRVDTNPVGMKFFEPVLRIAQQRTPHFVAPEIENVGGPFGMEALPRIDVLVQRAAVETPKAKRVGREMRGSPVENHSDTVLMQAVDQVAEVVRRSVAGSGGIVTRRLVSPGTGERMLHHGKEFDVREAYVPQVLDELHGQFAIAERPVAFFGNSPPRTEMHLIDSDRGAQRVPRVSLGHPRRMVKG